MTSGLPNTSDPSEGLISSLTDQPLLVVLRPGPNDYQDTFESTRLCRQLDQLVGAGVLHVELAWAFHPRWPTLVDAIRERYPEVRLGAASVSTLPALQQVANLGLGYAMSPLLDPELQSKARDLCCVLVPGVMTPSEIRSAQALGCSLVKLFPASVLGVDYRRQISAPMGELPFMIAAGGLRCTDLIPWLAAGYNAVALGRTVFVDDALDPGMKPWLGG